jgi:hypothetical protein
MIQSTLVVEVFDEERGPIACVLRRKNCGRSAMIRIMNRLMNLLDDEEPRDAQVLEPQPSGGEPPAPPSPDRREPPEDDRRHNAVRRTRRM